MGTGLLVVILASLAAQPTEQGLECGKFALAIALKAGGYNANTSTMALEALRGNEPPYSFAQLIEACKSARVPTRLQRITPKELDGEACPSILLWKKSNSGPANHFVVCLGARDEHFLIVDFPYAPVWVHRSDLESKWGGECLTILQRGIGRFLSDGPALVAGGFVLVGLMCLLVAFGVGRRLWYGGLWVPKASSAFTGAAFLALVASASIGWDASRRLEQPTDKLEISPSVVQVAADGDALKSIRTSFRISNGGPNDLKIERIRSSCTCLVVGIPESAIVPSHGSIEVVLDVRPPAAGMQTSRLDIETGGGGPPKIVPVVAVTRGALPLIHSLAESGRCVFADSDGRYSTSVIINTKEAKGSAPWLVGGKPCGERSKATMTLKSENEMKDRDVAAREYSLKLTGALLKSESEAVYSIEITTRDGASKRLGEMRVIRRQAET